MGEQEPILVIETIEGSPHQTPRELTPEEFRKEVSKFVAAGMPLPAVNRTFTKES